MLRVTTLSLKIKNTYDVPIQCASIKIMILQNPNILCHQSKNPNNRKAYRAKILRSIITLYYMKLGFPYNS